MSWTDKVPTEWLDTDSLSPEQTEAAHEALRKLSAMCETTEKRAAMVSLLLVGAGIIAARGGLIGLVETWAETILEESFNGALADCATDLRKN